MAKIHKRHKWRTIRFNEDTAYCGIWIAYNPKFTNRWDSVTCKNCLKTGRFTQVRIDFTGVSDGFEPIPEGDYEANFTGFKVFESSKSSGKPYVQMEYTVSEDEFSGRKLWRNRSLQPQSLWALKRDMVRLGAYDEQISGEVDIEDTLEELLGSSCRLKVGQYEYDGEIRNEVKDVVSAEYAF